MLVNSQAGHLLVGETKTWFPGILGGVTVEEYGIWPWKRWLNPFLFWMQLPFWWIMDRVYWVIGTLWTWTFNKIYSLIEAWVNAPLLIKFIYLVNWAWMSVLLITFLILGLEAVFMLAALYDMKLEEYVTDFFSYYWPIFLEELWSFLVVLWKIWIWFKNMGVLGVIGKPKEELIKFWRFHKR